MTWRHGVVRSLGRSWTGAQELTVQLLGDDEPLEVRALAYPDLVGVPSPGERVLLNTNAQQRGLGTGGYALVVARPDQLPNDTTAGPGHNVNARYTPTMMLVHGADGQQTQRHSLLYN